MQMPAWLPLEHNMQTPIEYAQTLSVTKTLAMCCALKRT